MKGGPEFRVPASSGEQLGVAYAPILDVAHGTTAGYQSRPRVGTFGDCAGVAVSPLDLDLDGTLTARTTRLALSLPDTLPPNTFLTVPIGAQVAATPPVRDALTEYGTLAGIVLDLTGFVGEHRVGALDAALDDYRATGALIAIGGRVATQPELSSIVRFRPSILRLGRDWIRGVDHSESKRSTIEMIGRLAGHLDAWVLAEGIETAAELRALVRLGVPLAQGGFIGIARTGWTAIDLAAIRVLPRDDDPGGGVLIPYVQAAYTARNVADAVAVLPETAGFELVVIVDEQHRPVSLLERTQTGSWVCSQVMIVNVNTPITDVIMRAMTRPRATRFGPLACTDDTGTLLGIVAIERLMHRLTG